MKEDPSIITSKNTGIEDNDAKNSSNWVDDVYTDITPQADVDDDEYLKKYWPSLYARFEPIYRSARYLDALDKINYQIKYGNRGGHQLSIFNPKITDFASRFTGSSHLFPAVTTEDFKENNAVASSSMSTYIIKKIKISDYLMIECPYNASIIKQR